MTTPAAKATEAAEALLAWLRDQPPLMFQQRGAAETQPTASDAGATEASPSAAAVGPPAVDAGADGTPAQSPLPSMPCGDAAGPVPGAALSPGAAADSGHDAPLRLAHTDWLYHRLAVTGPAAALAAFRTAAAGAGIIPWHLDLDRLTEDCFHRLAAPPPPQQRSLSLAGARIVAGQLRDAVARRHDLAVAQVGEGRACPFDLYALVPVPADILRRGPDDPASLAWLWTSWGTTRELRHVAVAAAASQDRQHQPAAGEEVFRLVFWSADWSPWRALARIAIGFPALRFDLRPSYDAP